MGREVCYKLFASTIINIVCICELIKVTPLIISLSITCILYQNFMRKENAPRCQAGGINEEAVYIA